MLGKLLRRNGPNPGLTKDLDLVGQVSQASLAPIGPIAQNLSFSISRIFRKNSLKTGLPYYGVFTYSVLHHADKPEAKPGERHMSLRDARPLLRSCRPCFAERCSPEKAESFCSAKPNSHERMLGSCRMMLNVPRLQDLALFLSDLHRAAGVCIHCLTFFPPLHEPWSRSSACTAVCGPEPDAGSTSHPGQI